MARVTRNSLLQGISGKLGGLIIRQVGSQTIVSAAPAPGSRPARSPKQQAHLDKFAAAVRYAQAQMRDPLAKALYATGTNDTLAGAYNVALADYLHGPTITALHCPASPGQSGQPIRVWATDNFGVTAVLIHLHTAEGQALETGPATAQPDGHWLYLTQHPQPAGTLLTIRATDRPGNVAETTRVL